MLPTDAQVTCGVDQTAFNSWFSGGTATAGGAVEPANGFDFPPPATNTKCDFYKWGAQMFLWLTSPDSAGGVVVDGAQFYDVVPDGSGNRKFIQNGSSDNLMQLRSVKSITSEGTGQAGGGDVLINANNSLVYYGVHANDIYAWFRTGTVNGALSELGDDFPTTEDQVNLIVEYAIDNGAEITDTRASTMELKTSWVDASTVTKADFVTAQAVVPTYDETGDTWVVTGTETIELALVGMHIAAPVLGHPELVWISYEHINNAPMADYVYTTTGGDQSLVAYNASGTWTFDVDATYTPDVIVPNAAQQSDGSIKAKNGGPIGPVKVAQKNPWGVAPGPNNDAGNNTDLVSLNVSVMGMLSALSDVRANYYQIGGIWTSEGQLPLSGTDGTIRGGLRLANSTMETFHQYPDHNGFTSENCFTCHSVSDRTSPGVNVSHIFGSLNPLGSN
ncbi:hypothetical protein [Thalassococcus lentus]|uniref:Cytochrome c family protein n=1 Tax=Thalassococcus lentus TaxID=1210524 RepID=A0ABT4XXG7_9RHOB|nr:hypothetical protein [Thalassococcus lentus]MDA7426656.1 hypothetical protein [Thalassococcus lentus]